MECIAIGKAFERQSSIMSAPTFASRYNLDLLESNYQRWQRDPQSVDEAWRIFFEGFDLGGGNRQHPSRNGVATASQSPGALDASAQIGIVQIIDAYRGLGHLLSRLDPLSDPPTSHPLLELSNFGLSEADMGRTFDTSAFLGLPRATLGELITALKDTYCGSIGVEYMHIQDMAIRRWLQERMEPTRNRPNYARRQKLHILMELHFAEMFEKFLHKRFIGQKRFSLEGAETLIPLLDFIVERCADSGVRELVLGMAHRGRLNVLANIINKPYSEIFSEFQDNFQPNSMGDGDVKYHLGFSCDRTSAKGNRIHLSLTPNPSHLEAVNPVVEGRTRAKQHHFKDVDRARSVPLLIHGDAAVAGQGLVAETLNLSQLAGYKTGGTIHVVVNNQIGFTTSPTDARSTRYCTDVAKMIDVPIFHVNGEDPEAAMFVAELAVEFRQTFHKDVFIDMYCFRRHGHNEGDDPSFTQPLMYAKIQKKQGLTQIYSQQLLNQGALSAEESQAITQEFDKKLEKAQEENKTNPTPVGMKGFAGAWKNLTSKFSHVESATGVPYETLKKIAEGLIRVPEGMKGHPKVIETLEKRVKNVVEKKPVDWGTGEALAFGSLLLEGIPIRLSGQDSGRGTFSHRHSVLFDPATGQRFVPLQHLDPQQQTFSVYDSFLSEAAVLGFEFGYSLDSPNTLVMWEAQFGDFANGAQVIIDQYFCCSLSKWQRDSGLVLLLPHGYEGAGPEHSSARLERFLQLCAEDNIQVVYPTTPAQMFHLLRRQMHRPFRKPLVVMTPKSLLRHKVAVSPIEAFTTGRFQEVIDDSTNDPGRVRRVLLCSGKVYYDLLEERNHAEVPVAIIRVEQFYPFPKEQLQKALERYQSVREVLWVQEESLNMGGWSFMEPRLRSLLGIKPKYVGRDSSASPATGSHKIHDREQEELVKAAITGPAPYLARSIPNQPTQPRMPGLALDNYEPVELPEPEKVIG